ncbi:MULTISPECIES: ABC transporter ATP-binding protein [Glycomyces]|uniref:ABC-2 type transport system ATP-binding protein n=2 Tax=Glycomyces TaxID=58113 RepID=A0A9X3PDK2_9ACTN|nr:ATP-binding cassette domain-containing protein [Glycomyces lechevalierae]MDA1383634.1 ATP-binding cassette domain-containing protein [Glycomyces lechevalierae]MDR7341376.1 ABC-2 type transport system ATP-binding protein [Glycomyces lechevalierae]
MHPPHRLEIRGLTKRFGKVEAVTDLTFDVEPGRVTGFLGPNGSGKTTTLRMLLGLVAPDGGTARIGGRRYRDLPEPARTVGAALEASNFHPARTGRDHLRVYADMLGVPTARVEEALALTGITDAAHRRAGGYSTGMRQRLNLATALLGDPPVLVLDEPTNGLDPEGIAWLRGLLRRLAGEGRMVLVASHVLSEAERLVDDVVVMRRGRLLATGPLAALTADGIGLEAAFLRLTGAAA